MVTFNDLFEKKIQYDNLTDEEKEIVRNLSYDAEDFDEESEDEYYYKDED